MWSTMSDAPGSKEAEKKSIGLVESSFRSFMEAGKPL